MSRLFALLLALATSLVAQEVTGAIVGVVKDSSGSLVTGAVAHLNCLMVPTMVIVFVRSNPAIEWCA